VTAPAAPVPVVLDTSAVLAWLRGEPGAAVGDPLLGAAANWDGTAEFAGYRGNSDRRWMRVSRPSG
jgi:hypothetical protein